MLFLSTADDVDSLPIKPDDTWLNMGKIADDKLAWTKHVPAPSLGDKKTGNTARFDFQVNAQPTKESAHA